jgi:hypothetical protein
MVGWGEFYSLLTYKLALPPIDPATDESGKTLYFEALRAADSGDLAMLNELWLNRLLLSGENA